MGRVAESVAVTIYPPPLEENQWKAMAIKTFWVVFFLSFFFSFTVNAGLDIFRYKMNFSEVEYE